MQHPGRVAVLTTGGTIASRHDPARDAVVAGVAGAALLAGVPGLPADLAVTVEDFCNIGSFAMDLDTSFRLARRVDAVLADPAVAGVVVTHGTDTMEESAFLSDLVVSSDKPVVFTGAQRAADQPDADGPRNLGDAIRLAAAPDARDLGTMILFDGEFHAARDATKIHTSRVGTFASHEHGKLGDVDDGTVRVQRRPVRRPSVPAATIEPRVELIRLSLGAGGGLLRAACADGARGIVLEGFGRGNATPGIADAVREARRNGIPVLMTSRCPQGRAMPVYGGQNNSGGRDLVGDGVLFGGDLSGIKARILLALLLGCPDIDLAAEVERAAG